MCFPALWSPLGNPVFINIIYQINEICLIVSLYLIVCFNLHVFSQWCDLNLVWHCFAALVAFVHYGKCSKVSITFLFLFSDN